MFIWYLRKGTEEKKWSIDLKLWLLTPEMGTLCVHCTGGGVIPRPFVDGVWNIVCAIAGNYTPGIHLVTVLCRLLTGLV
jgi:hypothetical protein